MFGHPVLTRKNSFQSIKILTSFNSIDFFFFLLKLYLVCTDRRNPVLCSLLLQLFLSPHSSSSWEDPGEQ